MPHKRLLRFLSARGFSLAETLISAALLGGVGVTMLTLDDSQSVDENFSETDLIIETLYQRIYTVLEDPQACTKTLQGGPGGKKVFNGKRIPQIVNRDTGNLIGEAGQDSRKMVEVTQIVLRRLKQESGHNYAEIDMEITFKKLSRQLAQNSGPRSIIHSIPLQIDFVPGTNELESCFLPATESANTLICRQFFGTYNEKTQECTLPFYGEKCPHLDDSTKPCHRSMAKFDDQARFSCVSTSIEPNNDESCPWTE